MDLVTIIISVIDGCMAGTIFAIKFIKDDPIESKKYLELLDEYAGLKKNYFNIK